MHDDVMDSFEDVHDKRDEVLSLILLYVTTH